MCYSCGSFSSSKRQGRDSRYEQRNSCMHGLQVPGPGYARHAPRSIPGRSVAAAAAAASGRKLLQHFGQWDGQDDGFHRFNQNHNEESAAAASSAAAATGAHFVRTLILSPSPLLPMCLLTMDMACRWRERRRCCRCFPWLTVH